MAEFTVGLFAGAFGFGVPVGKLAEDVVEGGAVGGAGAFQAHGEEVAALQGNDNALLVMGKRRAGAAADGFVEVGHRMVEG